MEKRKESLSDIKVCRFCLCKDSTLSSLYDRSRDPILVTLPLKIMACVSIEVFPSDKMPSYICERCRTFMDICYEFKQICRRADESCLQFVQNGIPISAIKWPPNLTKIFQMSKRARPSNAIVEGVSTIRPASQDMSENEEEDTYNVKIDVSGDGSKGFPRQVSVGGEKEPQVTPKKEDTSLRKYSDDKSVVGVEPLTRFRCREAAVRKGVMVRVRRRSSGLGTWPCDLCDSSYSLHQLLEIHKAQKHRARNVQCGKCDVKFFSKYDLMTHQLRHTNEMPFQCVACNSKFKRLILLKRHEKMAHSDLPKHVCTNCPVTFLSKEELEAHQKRHEGYFSRQHVCTICDRKFHTKGTLQRHRDVVHGKKQFSCEYCPHRFTTVSKLTRHVRAHAGDRAYPCKYCNKSFIKSHHYTRHLRLKHEEEVRAARGGTAELRCEQCGEGFATQDDLYYHSAVHATQSLTCPLCQEQFENVDAVTAHIRTHVNGIEFMCEYCELVFTSKEKLDTHMIAAHDDEITPRQELGMDESSLEADGADADADDDDEDNGLNVKEEGDLMVVEIKKAEGYMLRKGLEVGQTTNTTSEDSEIESTYTELATVDTLALASQHAATKSEATSSKATSSSLSAKANERIGILRKAEAIKRKAADKEEFVVPNKKGQPGKVDSTTNNASSSDKTLRMLEKELQELTRTNTRNEKTAKAGEAKTKRQPAHSCTLKLKTVEEKRAIARPPPASDKKAPERRPVTKDKDARDAKEARNAVTSSKEDKSVSSTREDKAGDSRDRNTAGSSDKKPSAKEDSEKAKSATQDSATVKPFKEIKAKAISKEEASSSSKSEVPSTSTKRDSIDASKNDEFVKNGDASSSEDNLVRRSTRPSKIKNYASMARDGAGHVQDEEEEEAPEDSEMFDAKEADSRSPLRRRVAPKRQQLAAAQASARRRGRTRKEHPGAVKDSPAEDTPPEGDGPAEVHAPEEAKEPEVPEATNAEAIADSVETPNLASTSPTSTEPQQPATLVSPTGQTLKKVPIQALPPGIKPLPLPLNARRDVCQMQIGKKMVKVQKIVMTKAEVEAMAKKGLVELKDGTMVLKQGIKLPGGDPTAMRSGLMSQGAIKKLSSTPTRCHFEGEET